MDQAALVRSVWEHNLRPDSLNDDDSFFDLGGDSLLAIMTCEEIAQQCGAPERIDELLLGLYENPSLTGFCSIVSALQLRND